MKGVTDKKEKIVSIIKPDLFTIGTITLSNLGIFKIVIFNAKINTKDFTFKFMHFERQI
jgi:pyruvate/2-oxoglutarate dehydrogenase complex dihydrolipoamide acyltransferase (E2) component